MYGLVIQLLAHVVLPVHRRNDQKLIANMPQYDFAATKQFQESQISRNLDLVERLRDIGRRHGMEPGVVAIACTLHNSAITAAILSGRSAKQVEGLLPSATFRLGEDESAEIWRFLRDRP